MQQRNRKLSLYVGVSVLATLLSQAGLAFAFGVWRWPIVASMLFALAVSIVPAFILSELLIWSGDKSSRRLHQRATAFVGVSVIGSLLSIAFVWLAVKIAGTLGANHMTMSLTANFSSLGSGLVIWIFRYKYLERRVYKSTVSTTIALPPSSNARSNVEES